MNDATAPNVEGKVTVGLDLGDKHTQLCMIAEGGELLEEARLRTTPAVLRRRIAGAARGPSRPRSQHPFTLMSAVSSKTAVTRSCVANPRNLRLTCQNDSKSDRVDAEYLARIGRLDPALLAPLRHRHAAAGGRSRHHPQPRGPASGLGCASRVTCAAR